MKGVQPNMNVPKKPAPYKSKSDRTRNTQGNPITPPSQSPTELSSVNSNDCGYAAIHNGGKATQEMKSNVPKKPAPYKSKLDRTRNTHGNPITPPSQYPTQPSPVHSNESGHAPIQQDNHNGDKAKQEVESNVPKKPPPSKPKSDRTRGIYGNPITSPSQDPTEPPSGQPHDGRQETSSPPSDVTYAQVSSVPIRQSSSSQIPVDDTTYAELDMTSHTTQDGGATPSSSVADAPIYATVDKTK